MSLEQATSDELILLQKFEQDYSDLLDLAGYVAFMPRIEQRLLRAIRLKFLPRLDEIQEHQLWFSDLVFSRSTGHLTFSPGSTIWLTQRIRQKLDDSRLQALYTLCQQMTRHWEPLDRLERDLYFHSLTENRVKLHQVFRDLLRLISQYSKQLQRNRSRLIELARRIKYGTAYFTDDLVEHGSARLLASFAANSLRDSGGWSTSQRPVALPDWLVSALPQGEGARLAVELHDDSDTGKYILHFKAPGESPDIIEFHGPLPAQLYIQAEASETGYWEEVEEGSLILLDTTTNEIELTTRLGKHYRLKADRIPSPPPQKPGQKRLLLAFSKYDENRAKQVQQWLKSQYIEVELAEEKPGATPATATDSEYRVLRLWTEGMHKLWSQLKDDQKSSAVGSLLLQADDIEPPQGFATPGRIIDIRNWAHETGQSSRQVVDEIENWVKGEDRPQQEPARDEYEEERTALLAEIENPDTSPERRLEIGDRLDEIGDTRRGVGVIEIEVPNTIGQPPVEEPDVKRFLAELDNPETKPERRLEIGDELNDMPGGDPRFGVGLNADGWPEIDWVNIPAGEFIYGEGSDEEKRYLDAFEIARYPVTNTQYQAFVDDKGYDDKRWWTGLTKPQLETSNWPQGNRPRTNIDRYEAIAFTRWLSNRLGYTITLPHETQWERAARGQEGRVYPWGAEYLSGYANVDEKVNKVGPYYLEQTTAVGVYRNASTQEGLLDLSGNVWEWCRNDYDKPDEEVEVPGSPVLRGGAWGSGPYLARAANRFDWGDPDLRDYGVGFRLLRSPPS